ncbi:MAG: YqgE/AlgH family protein [Nocardioidaceae bacterium]
MAYYTGQLLLATPKLLDPNFLRGVVLVLDDDEDGALGVVLNRPSTLPLAAVLPSWSEAAAEPPMLFTGGPVSPDSAIAVGLRYGQGQVVGFRPLTGPFGLIDLDAEPDELVRGLAGLRVFSGYAGWGHDQLEDEIAEGSWYVVESMPDDLLHPQPDGLWRSVLRRQPGELAYVATYPDDPNLN